MLLSLSAHAQRYEHERERFRTPHWVLDDRFHHDHYYPGVGYSMSVLPAGNIAISWRGARYWYHSGVWFAAAGPGYVVARPPLGIVVPVLPPAYSTVYVGGAPYYYANDVYYVAQPAGGYMVAEPPMSASAPQTPPPAPQASAAPQPAPGTWYYCESAKTYYPYVSQCKEGCRPVAAAPPAK